MKTIILKPQERIATHFGLVLFVYIFSYFSTILMPFAMILFVTIVALKNYFLSLRVAIIATVVLINNQFIISDFLNTIYEQPKLHMYTIVLLFYYVVIGLIFKFSKFRLTKELKYFLFLTLIVFLSSYQNVSKSILFLINVVGGFIMLFIMINSFSKFFNYKNIHLFKVLEKDYFYIVLITLIFSLSITFIDLTNDFEYLRIQAESLAHFRGKGEVVLLHGFPKQYTTAFLNFDFLLRYTPFINDPVRAANWYLYFGIFLLYFKFNSFIKFLFLSILFVFFISCWSKGAFISVFLISLFYLLYKYKLYKLAILLFVTITTIFIILSGILKSSAVIHVMGLLLPFKANIDIHYFFGNDFFQAGNMGRIDFENWTESVKRGAESLVGTYMYAYGLLGVFIYMLIHYKTIKLLNHKKIYIVASIITVSLFISFLQEGQYNLLQVYSMCMVLFFLMVKIKLKENKILGFTS